VDVILVEDEVPHDLDPMEVLVVVVVIAVIVIDEVVVVIVITVVVVEIEEGMIRKKTEIEIVIVIDETVVVIEIVAETVIEVIVAEIVIVVRTEIKIKVIEAEIVKEVVLKIEIVLLIISQKRIILKTNQVLMVLTIKNSAKVYFFVHLLSGVEPDIIDWSLVTEGSTDDEKLLNSKYAISLARKIGAVIFLLPEDIVEVKSKMCLTFGAAVMAVGLLKNKNK